MAEENCILQSFYVDIALSINSSSFIVPDFGMSVAENIRFSANFLSSIISTLPVPLNSWKINSPSFESVSVRAVVITVEEPPFSMLRAVPKKKSFGLCNAFESAPPFRTSPDEGIIGYLETSVRNYHHSPRNNPEECSSQLLRGESLKSR